MENIKLVSKLPNSGTSVFARMTELAILHNAINLAQGFPDFLPPEELFTYLQEAVKSGYNQYAPMPGLLMLREQLALRVYTDYNYSVNVDTEITITAGATQAIYTIISSLIGYGDKVLIFEPAYDSYAPSVLINGGIPVYIRLKEPTFEIPWDEFEECLSGNDVKLIIINNPHNPAGTILSHSDMLKIAKIVEQTNAIIVWDEVYDMLVYDNKKHSSALLYMELMQRSIVVFSLGKTLHNTGWKLGYIIANQEFTKEIRKAHQFTVFSVNTPSQYAVAKFIENNSNFFTQLGSFYETKRDYFLNLVSESKLNFLKSPGSYFILAGYNHLGDKSDEQIAKEIVSTCGVACVPISAFYHDGYNPRMLRFCFAKKESTLQEAAHRLQNISERINFSS
ncbi:MAG: methionine aminotransferase [Saprospiraceae bacterium]